MLAIHVHSLTTHSNHKYSVQTQIHALSGLSVRVDQI